MKSFEDWAEKYITQFDTPSPWGRSDVEAAYLAGSDARGVEDQAVISTLRENSRVLAELLASEKAKNLPDVSPYIIHTPKGAPPWFVPGVLCHVWDDNASHTEKIIVWFKLSNNYPWMDEYGSQWKNAEPILKPEKWRPKEGERFAYFGKGWADESLVAIISRSFCSRDSGTMIRLPNPVMTMGITVAEAKALIAEGKVEWWEEGK